MNIRKEITLSDITNTLVFVAVVGMLVWFATTDKPADVLAEVRQMQAETNKRVDENSSRIEQVLEANLVEVAELRKLNNALAAIITPLYEYIDEKTQGRYTADDAKSDWDDVKRRNGIKGPARFDK